MLSILEFGAVAGFTQMTGASVIGSFFVFQAVTGIIGIPGDLGVSRATEKQLSAKKPTGEVISTSLALKTLLLAPWILGFIFTSSYINDYIGVEGIVPLVAIGLITSQGQQLSIRILAGQLQVGRTALLRVVGKLVWVVAGFVLISGGWGAKGIIGAFILGDLTTIAGAIIRMDISIGIPKKKRAREMLDFGRYVFIGSVGGYIYSWMDVAILRLFIPTSLIGAYEIAWRVASLSVILTKAIRDTLFAQVSEWNSEGKIKGIENAFKKWLQPPLYLTIPAFVGAVVLGKDILDVVFGPETVVAYPVLIVFMLERIMRSVHMLIGPSLFAMDEPKLGYRGSIVAIIINLALNILLIPSFGMMGAAIATTFGSLSSAIVNIIYVQRFITLRLPWSRIVWSCGSALLMGIFVLFTRASLHSGQMRVILGVSIGFISYLLLLFIHREIRCEIKYALSEILGL